MTPKDLKTDIYMFFVQFFADKKYTNQWVKDRELVDIFRKKFPEGHYSRRYILYKLRGFVEFQDKEVFFEIKFLEDKNYNCFFVKV